MRLVETGPSLPQLITKGIWPEAAAASRRCVLAVATASRWRWSSCEDHRRDWLRHHGQRNLAGFDNRFAAFAERCGKHFAAQLDVFGAELEQGVHRLVAVPAALHVARL